MEIYNKAIEDERKAVFPIFEYNCLQIDGTAGGCPVCPLCKEPAYETTHCVFCGVKFKEDDRNV